MSISQQVAIAVLGACLIQGIIIAVLSNIKGFGKSLFGALFIISICLFGILTTIFLN